jgi:cell division transport system permease protein
MKPDATEDQNAAIKKVLDDPNSEIKSYKYLNQQDAYDEFKQLFSDKPDLIESVTPEVLPPSYRVVPVDTDADAVANLGAQFDGQPGVREVRFATEALRNLEELTDSVKIGLTVAAVVLLGVAVLLILNTISTAMASRRREIEVMKLVGATNWFIRVPFMLEGLVHGIFGAGLAVGGMVAVESIIFPRVRRNDILQYFQVASSQVWTTGAWMMLIGCVVGVIGSLWAVSRYLDV